MKLITAERIHNGHEWLPTGATIEVADDGTIAAVHNSPIEGAVRYDGVLAPGFVNVHCHLELSHMRGVVPERTGLIPFLKSIPQYRNDFTEEQKTEARHRAYHHMLNNGIVAVGDIANTADTTDVRALGKMHFHTFVEALGFTPQNADRAFEYALMVYAAYAAQHGSDTLLRQSITPHAPYSVSDALFCLIDRHLPAAPISIHNQESEEENRFYTTGEGLVCELLQMMGIDHSSFRPTGKPSLESYLQWMSKEHPFIFVHNTSSTEGDVRFAHTYAPYVHWCLCPNANLYIEGRLPDIDMLIREGANLCIGTDSLASNHQLCVLSELCTIKTHFPHLGWETLLQWGTANGAAALQMQDVVGTLAPGTRPGMIQIRGLETRPSVTRII
ncbi:amidohydrolase family protein [Nemorincola caseinilytica]|uniref:Amidohydrolase family protein n=1 Tax=Nemorincola caseinilytica TaxID=2054315 RepID=A0ABP8NNX8_9BACT